MITALVEKGQQPVLAKGAFDSLVGKVGSVAAVVNCRRSCRHTRLC